MWLQIKVLLWKSLQLRKKHWLSTIIEIIIPCLMVYSIYSLHLFSKHNKTSNLNQTIQNPVSVVDSNNESLKTNLIFSPNSNLSQEIMNNLGDTYYNVNGSFNDEKKLVDLLTNKSKQSHKYIGILFEKINFPLVFEYKLILVDHKTTSKNQFKSVQYQLGNNEHDRKHILQTSHFYRLSHLQSLLDKSYISFHMRGSNKTIEDYSLKIQTFPYKKFMQDDNLILLLHNLFPLLTVLTFLVTCTQAITIIVDEKNSGAEEFMKIKGLNCWMIWIGWILHNSFTYTISITVITYISCFKINQSTEPLLNFTNPILLWIFLMMYMIAGNFFCIVISTLFKNPLIALIICGKAWIYTYLIPLTFLNASTSTIVNFCVMLLPNVAVTNGITTILSLESLGLGLQTPTLFFKEKGNNSFSVGFVIFVFVVQCYLYGLIAWYLDSVMPRTYGIAKPLNFWYKSFQNNPENNSILLVEKKSKFFEKRPDDSKVGISIKNLHKQFGSVNALDGVDLEMYQREITILLGHNGAGKTTTTSIIMGLFYPSSGSVEVNVNNVLHKIDKFRANLGLFSQHNLLFSYLTVLDHLIFFGMLRELTLERSKLEGLLLLEVLNMLQEKDESIITLSEVMKRKVSLAIALVGNPEILILDEPTAGMDAKSRRDMWDLLLSLRRTKTILITTQLVEEAEILGDRIAIMDKGQVKCYGTPSFLKKMYGMIKKNKRTGYKLTIFKGESCIDHLLVKEIKQIIAVAEIRRSSTSQLIIYLPNETAGQFPILLKTLETNRIEFGIKRIGVSFATMEEVYLSFTDNGHGDKPKPITNNDVDDALVPMYTSGIMFLTNQLKVLLKKKVIYNYRQCMKSWFTSLICFFQLITVCQLVIKSSYNILNGPTPTSLTLNVSFNSYADIEKIYYRAGDNSIHNLASNIIAMLKENHAIDDGIPSEHYSIEDLLEKYHQDLLVCTIGNVSYKTNLTIVFNKATETTPNIAINLYTNALLKKLSENNKSYISTVIELTEQRYDESFCGHEDLYVQVIILWIMYFSLELLPLAAYFMALPLTERVSGIKHLQMMTKLSPITYWAACFTWDYFSYIIFVISLLVTMYFFDEAHLFTRATELGVLFTLMLVYGLSAIFYAYVYSFFNKTIGESTLKFMRINISLGLVVNMILFYQRKKIFLLNEASPFNFWNIFRYITLIIPHVSYSSCMIGFLDKIWKKNRSQVCNLRLIDDAYNYKSYFVFPSRENGYAGILEETLFMLFSSLFYIAIIILFEYKVFTCAYQCCFSKCIDTDVDYKEIFKDVNDERKKVLAAKTSISYDEPSPILLVDNLVNKFNFKFTAIRGISYAVSPGECFGLLDVNGTDKTTTFDILTGHTFATKGDAYIRTNNLYKLSSDTKQYSSMIGYCPQFDALNDELTGMETLRLMAILRGIAPSNVEKHVNVWIKLLGLEEYKNTLCGKYCWRIKRKINIATALIGDPPVVFMNDPTSGFDPESKRYLWQIIAARQRGGQALILASHDLNEIEALCNRLTIIVDGEMRFIGNIQYLKNCCGQCFTIKVKLLDYKNANVEEIKSDMESNFAPNVVLKDEHKELLHYNITNYRTPLSEILGRMEAIKKKYLEIEDYIFGDTTLEDVFVEFAKREVDLNTCA